MGPAEVVSIRDGVVTLVHNERTKTSSLNRIQKTQPPLDFDDYIDEDCGPISRNMPHVSDTPQRGSPRTLSPNPTESIPSPSEPEPRYTNAVDNPV